MKDVFSWIAVVMIVHVHPDRVVSSVILMGGVVVVISVCCLDSVYNYRKVVDQVECKCKYQCKAKGCWTSNAVEKDCED